MSTNLPAQETILRYNADGVTATFPYPNVYILEKTTDIGVWVTDDATVTPTDADLKVYGTDYTYTANINPITGGTITFLSGHIPASGHFITINRITAPSIDVQFSNVENFNGQNLDNALVRIMLVLQQVNTYMLQRNLSYRINANLNTDDVVAQTQIPVLGENQIWQGTGDAVVAVDLEENPDVSTLRSELALATAPYSGAQLVGFYSALYSLGATTVYQLLTNILSQPASAGAGGANYVGYTDLNTNASTIAGFLNKLQQASSSSVQGAKWIHYWNGSNTTVADQLDKVLAYQTIVQSVFVENSTPATITSTMPDSSTVVITDGTQIFSQSFTPKYATSKLRIRCYIPMYAGTSGSTYSLALFHTKTHATNAINATGWYVSTGNKGFSLICERTVSAVDTAARTISARVGETSGASGFFLKLDNGTTAYGGTTATLTIDEIYQP